jgi:hypothetical protein
MRDLCKANVIRKSKSIDPNKWRSAFRINIENIDEEIDSFINYLRNNYHKFTSMVFAPALKEDLKYRILGHADGWTYTRYSLLDGLVTSFIKHMNDVDNTPFGVVTSTTSATTGSIKLTPSKTRHSGLLERKEPEKKSKVTMTKNGPVITKTPEDEVNKWLKAASTPWE